MARKTLIIKSVLISLENLVRAGHVQVIFRTQNEDKQKIDHAAFLLGMKPAEFMRTGIVQCAEQVLALASAEAIVSGEASATEASPLPSPIPVAEKPRPIRHNLSTMLPPGVKE